MNKNKEKDEIRKWVESYSKDLLSWAYYQTQSKEIAEDIVQECFLIALSKITDFKRESTPKTWLMGILNNKIKEYYRNKLKMSFIDTDIPSDYFIENSEWNPNKAPTDWGSTEHLLDDPLFKKIMNQCMKNIPSNWRQCIIMKYIMNKKTNIICQELNISVTNYWQMSHRAKLQIRDCIENKWFKKNAL